MFKKFLDLFFAPEEEEEEIVETNSKDEITMKDFEELVKEQEKEEIVTKEEEETPVKEKVEVKPKPSFDIITADGPVENKTVKKQRVLRREEYDIQPVISPYFGVKEENKPIVKVEKKAVSTYRKEVKKSAYSEVISPIYGVKEKMVEPSFVKNEEPVYVKENKTIPIPTFDMVEDEENIALDDILFGKDSGEDDMIQFSLFGDDKRIQEDVFKNEDIDDDSLPF